MAEPIDFYFDFRSPYSYLAATQLPRIAADNRRAIRYRPVDVLQLMAEVGNRPTSVECKAKRRYIGADLIRWSRIYRVPISTKSRAAESNSALLLGAAVTADAAGVSEQFAGVVFRALWADCLLIRTPEDLEAELARAGVDAPARLVASAAEHDEMLNVIRGEAISDGVFGVPSMVVDGKLFFGNDRLSFLEQALSK